MRRFTILTLLLAIMLVPLFAQNEDAQSNPFNFSAGISLGNDIIPGPNGTTETWNSLAFQPDIAFGKFGIGLDIAIRFKLLPTPDTAITIYGGDWIPNFEGNGKTFFDIYLPKLMYFRYGLRGEPAFVKIGSINDFTIGNGFLMNNYANTSFLPELRISGVHIGLDGTLFNFPYIGIEALTGNLARFDVVGARLFVRPLAWLQAAVIKDMQIGGSIITDSNPSLYSTAHPGLAPVTMGGIDVVVPIIQNKVFPLSVFSDYAIQPERWGWMLGFGGKLAGIIVYGAQLRIMSAGFIPAYFDTNYDLYRDIKALVLAQAPSGDGFQGWFAQLGFDVLESKLVFKVNLEGPFAAIPSTPVDNPALYPHLRGTFLVGEGLLGGFFFDFAYDKYFIGRDVGFFEDLVDPTNAVITAAVNFRSGSAVFTLLYNLRYNPDAPNGFDVTSSLKTTIKF
ncbi:MAG TPA: hypothetical protein PK025_08090 [Spirochaetales bacterium]|nr:hypothetical protein [Spirochaetales bacterium]